MLSVLYADGDRELRDTYAELFALRGIQARASGGGVDCLKQLRESAPDLLILDLELPWGGGLGVLGVMREEPHLRQIPVVMTSAASPVETLNLLTISPVVKSLPKPFRLAELLETIDGAPALEDLASKLEREIHMHTGRRVHDLRVDCVNGTALVRGRVRSYHAKQLVLVAAMRVLQGSGVEPRFEVEVE